MSLTLPPHSLERLPWAPADAGVKFVHDFEASVPPQLAIQDLHLDATTAALCQDARLALAVLDRSAAVHRPGVVTTLVLTEATASCLVDGIVATPQQLAAAHAKQSATAAAKATANAAAHLAAHTDASHRAVTLGSIALAFSPPRRMASGHQIAAAYRRIQTWRGGTDLWPAGADYVPPHPARIASLMDDLVAFAAREDIDPIAQAAIVHAQLRSIEPFPHANDRVARALVNGMWRSRRATETSVVPISAALAANTLRYEGAWRTFRDGDATPMVELVAQAALRATDAVSRLASRIEQMPEKWRDAARPRKGSAANALIEVLAANPTVNAQGVQELTGASQASAYDAIARLAEAGVLARVSPTKRDTAWAAMDVFEASQNLIDELSGGAMSRGRRERLNTPRRPSARRAVVGSSRA